jgi:hypothetical protein
MLEPAPKPLLTDYVRRNKPDPASKRDMIDLIAFYNQYKAEQLPVQR